MCALLWFLFFAILAFKLWNKEANMNVVNRRIKHNNLMPILSFSINIFNIADEKIKPNK